MFLNPASYFQLVWSPTDQSGAWEPPLLVAGFLYRILSPTDWISCDLSYILVQRDLLVGVTNCTHSTHPRSRLYSAIPRPDAPVIYIGAFPILIARPGRRSIYNISSHSTSPYSKKVETTYSSLWVHDQLGLSDPHCTKWADDQHSPAEPSLGSCPTFPSPKSTL